MSIYNYGLDILGASAADFMPWMKILGGALGGIGQAFAPTGAGAPDAKSQAEAQKKAIEDALEKEHQRQAAEKAAADAAKTRMILYALIGGVAVGGAALFLTRKRK